MPDRLSTVLADQVAVAAASLGHVAGIATRAQEILGRLADACPEELAPVAADLARAAADLRATAEADRDMAQAILPLAEMGFFEALVLGELDREAPAVATRVRRRLTEWHHQIDGRLAAAAGQPGKGRPS